MSLSNDLIMGKYKLCSVISHISDLIVIHVRKENLVVVHLKLVTVMHVSSL